MNVIDDFLLSKKKKKIHLLKAGDFQYNAIVVEIPKMETFLFGLVELLLKRL